LPLTDIGMPGQQEALIQALAATGTPVVLVRLRGGPVALSDALYADNETLPAIIDAPYPGEFGGDALAGVLLGSVSPSGRLACTVYASTFVDTRSIIDYNMNSADGVTYQYYTGTPQWPFGWGLSYTSWHLDWLSDAHQTIDADLWAGGTSAPPAYGVNVTNTGTVASDVRAARCCDQWCVCCELL
jgi:beta-glucosidase